MKRIIYISIIMLMFISVSTFSQQSEDPKTDNIETAEKIIDLVYTKTSEAITSIAEALKVPAEHVYEILVKQQVVIATSWLIACIISLLITSIFIYLFIKTDDEKELGLFGTILVIFGLLFIISIIGTISNIGGFINPEYGAIKDILSIL